MNILALWVHQQLAGFTSSTWATYRQFLELGAQVKKGSKASHVVFYKELTIKLPDGETVADDDTGKRMFARATPVFNAHQVDGYNPEPVVAKPMGERLATVDAFIAATGAVVEHGGQPAYIPSGDYIRMPHLAAFIGTKTSTPMESYYSTLLHELNHWTGAPTRLARDLTGRFGTEKYAMEELVAELASTFACAQLDISFDPKPDSAAYLANWLKVLKNDKKAVFTAASAASKAVSYLSSFSAPTRPGASQAIQSPEHQPA